MFFLYSNAARLSITHLHLRVSFFRIPSQFVPVAQLARLINKFLPRFFNFLSRICSSSMSITNKLCPDLTFSRFFPLWY